MGIRQRLYPDHGQEPWLVEHCHHARFVYNIGLEQRAMWRRDKHNRSEGLSAARVTTTTQMRELAGLRAELGWLRAGSSSVQQGALRDLDRAFVNFFAGRARYPVFKKRNHRQGSLYVRDLSVRRVNRKWGQVWVPKVGWVRFRISRLWADIEAATSARITYRHGRWHVSFTTPPADKIEARTGAAAGIDRGVANTLATSEGDMVQAPALTAGEQARFLALEQRLARQTRAAKTAGRKLAECRNRERILDQLAVLRRRLEDRRTNWVETTTTNLARTCERIAVEDLQIRNMVRRPTPQPDPAQPGAFLPNGAQAKAALNRAILASCWGTFLARLKDKMGPDRVLRVDPKNTSQQCAACGHVAAGNRESQAVFVCQACDHAADADTNAAINILARALTQPQPEDIGGSPVPPQPAPQEPDPGAIPATPEPA